MKTSIFQVALISVLFLPAASILADTEVGGPILSDTTWNLAHSPYIITSGILIGADATGANNGSFSKDHIRVAEGTYKSKVEHGGNGSRTLLTP